MQRYKCVISYDGASFSGYQVQPKMRTVQGEIEAALKKMHKGKDVRVTASGRTDTKVHAVGQVIHFDSPLEIPANKWLIALNKLTPDDIAIKSVRPVTSEFHARYSATGKEYRYFIKLTAEKDPFTRFYRYQFPHELNLAEMIEAANYLSGTHDYSSFCAANTSVVNKVRTVEQIQIIKEDDLLTIKFVGTGFLYNMVRILVGTLLEVGTGRRSAKSMKELLKSCDRQKAGKTAPPEGLYLWEVFYDKT